MCIRDRPRTGAASPPRTSPNSSPATSTTTTTACLLYTSDPPDDLLRVDLRGRRFFQAEDGIRDFCLSRGIGDVYKRQTTDRRCIAAKDVAKFLACHINHHYDC